MRFHVDACAPDLVAGWIDDNGPIEQLEVQINGKHTQIIAGNLYREDLQLAGMGDGHRAYYLPTTAELKPGDRLLFKRDGQPLMLVRVGQPQPGRQDGKVRFDTVTYSSGPVDFSAQRWRRLGRDPKAVLVGFSHVTAISRAYEQLAAQQRNRLELRFLLIEPHARHNPPWQLDGDRFEANPQIRKELEEILDDFKPDVLFASIWSNHHFVDGVSAGPEPFTFCLPDDAASATATDPPMPMAAGDGGRGNSGSLFRRIGRAAASLLRRPRERDGASNGAASQEPQQLGNETVIPYDLVRAYMMTRVQPHVDLVMTFRELTSLPVVVLAAPPPLHTLDPNGPPPPGAAEAIERYGFAPPSRRRLLWQLCERMFREEATSRGCPFLPVPPGTADADGFRSAAYIGHDWIHGNDSYGELVIEQMAEVLKVPQHASV